MRDSFLKKIILGFGLVLVLGTVFHIYKEDVKADIINVKIENFASKDISVKLEDYIVFSSQDRDYQFTYYCNENGNTVFSFGNGKFWAAKSGTATVIISGRDKEGRDSFIADYKIIISSEKSASKIVAEVKKDSNRGENQVSNQNLNSNPTLSNNLSGSQSIDMSLVSIAQTELVDKRIVVKTKDKRNSSFNLSVTSPVPLDEKTNAKLSFKHSNPALKYKLLLNTNLSITIEGLGKDVLIVTINEKDFVFSVDITEESLSETTIVLAVGDTYPLLLNGGEGLPVFWQSGNEAVASIDQSGMITALREGHSIITVLVGDKRFAAVVSVTSKIKKDVVHYTKSYSGENRYSQPKRMLDGFYDCSSLVWRAYHKYGHDIILQKYAPVAAAMGKYYTLNDKLIEGGINEENIKNMVFMPGDLLFIEGKENNKRYKNINHVEMIYGYSIEGFDVEGSPILGILYANNPQKNFKGFVGRPNTDESELSKNSY